MPPEHTTIGQLAQIVELIENNPWEPVLTTKSRMFLIFRKKLTSAFFGTLQCLAAHSKDMPSSLKKDILRAGGSDNDLARKAMRRVIREIRKDPTQRYLMGTSQAVDIVNGGVKG